MKISELIKALQEAQKECGDVPVILSSDSEGNDFGTLDKYTSVCPVLDKTETNKIGVCLFPFIDHCEDMLSAVSFSPRK